MSDSNGTVERFRDGSVAYLVLNHATKRNAMTLDMWSAIPALVNELENDPSVKAVVIRGAGDSAFSSGADISEFEQEYGNPESAVRYNQAVRIAQLAIEQIHKPTVAMVHGACVGGGCGLALSCDFRFAADDVRLGITPGKIGAAYSLPDTRRLVALVGSACAKDILFSGRLLNAHEAKGMGLLDKVVAKSDLESALAGYLELLAANSQQSIRVAKMMINSISGVKPVPDRSLEEQFQAIFHGADFKEGVAAFLQKRAPRF